MQFGFTSGIPSMAIAPFKCKLMQSDAASIARLYMILRQKLPDPFGRTKPTTSSSVALERYRSAITQAVSVEAQITAAITALEALFLK